MAMCIGREGLPCCKRNRNEVQDIRYTGVRETKASLFPEKGSVEEAEPKRAVTKHPGGTARSA